MYSHSPISSLFALLPLAGLAAIVLLARIRLRQRALGSAFVRNSDLVWATIPALILVWMAVWCGFGLITAEPRVLARLVIACTGASFVALWREELLARLERPLVFDRASLDTSKSGAEPCTADAPPTSPSSKCAATIPVIKNAVCLAIATWCSFLALETPWNALVAKLPATSVMLECALIGLALVGCYFVAQRHGGGGLVVVIAATGIGLAQYFLALFKGAAILPSDVLGIGTAVAVSQNYTYYLSSTALGGITYAVLAGMALSLARRRPNRENPLAPQQVNSTKFADLNIHTASDRETATPAPDASTGDGRSTSQGSSKDAGLSAEVHQQGSHRIWAAMVRTASGALALIACVALFVVPSYRNDFGVYIPDYWWALNRYSEYGFLPTFASAVQDIPITAPDGYSDGEAEQREAKYVQDQHEADASTSHTEAIDQFTDERPSVVAIMNESYSDLSIFNRLGGAYEGTSLATNPPQGTLAYGNLAVSVLGGGTCNSEFEFLAGTSMKFVGDGKYPYTLYNFSDAPSLARQLHDLGYHTTAIHPNKATNWNRDRVYEQMSFDDTQFETSFVGAEQYHTGVSDAETYRHVLDVLQTGSDPQFVFDVTMQNHSGYDTGKIPKGDRVDLELPGLDEATTAQVDEYLACINESDRALEEFLDQLRELNRPVVVIFFGDHQPLFTPQLNDAYYPGEEGIEHTERTHQTTYLVWANYAVAGMGEKVPSSVTSSTSQLAAQALWQVGAPLTDYQEAVLGTQKGVMALNSLGYLTPDGAWHGANEENQTMNDLAFIEYHDFAETVE